MNHAHPGGFDRDDDGEGPDWTGAACTSEDGDLFFPASGESTLPAKAICASCPIELRCREYGMSEHHGIWGGLSERDRRRIRRLRRLQRGGH